MQIIVYVSNVCVLKMQINQCQVILLDPFDYFVAEYLIIFYFLFFIFIVIIPFFKLFFVPSTLYQKVFYIYKCWDESPERSGKAKLGCNS
jgi:hypothetical protein